MVGSIATNLWDRLQELKGELDGKKKQLIDLGAEVARLQNLIEAMTQTYELERQYVQTRQLSLLPPQPSLTDKIISILDDGNPRSVPALVDDLNRRAWQFTSKHPGRSVHIALVGAQRRGKVVKEGDLWRKK